MISDNQALYATIQSIKEKLVMAGEDQWNSALHDALSISSVTGEVLGATRLELQRLYITDLPSRLNFERQLNAALAYLNRILS